MPETPPALLTILTLIGTQIEALAAAASQANLTRGFTLDGRIIGDIGEILVAQFFEVELHNRQSSRHDGTTQIGGVERGVQIKCRKASTVIDFSSVPDLLLVISFSADWTQWEVIYNGSGDIVRQLVQHNPPRTVDDKGRIRNGDARASIRMNLDGLREASARGTMENVPRRSQPLEIF
jgi:hypothetical protein